MNNGVNPITNVGDDSVYGGGTSYNNGYGNNNGVNSQNENVVLRTNSNTFSDVSGNQVNISEYVNSKGLMIGTGDNTFNPSGTVTRAQMVQTLYAMAGKPPVSGDSQFSDVSSDKWYNDAINWAQQNGIVAGYTDGSFKPNQEIKRQEMLAIMNKYATYCGENTSQSNSAFNYSDASEISDYAVAPISWGVEHGMISDDLSNLRPTANATRIELAQMLMRYDQDYNGSTGRSAHVGAGAANMQITDVAGNIAASQASNVTTSSSAQAQQTEVVSIAGKYMGIPYVYGGENPSTGLDCSALTQHIYKDLGYDIGRTTVQQKNAGYAVNDALNCLNSNDFSSASAIMQPGDLIICHNDKGGEHVLMYAGNGNVIHASSSKGVTETSLSSLKYWVPDYMEVRRIIQ